MWAVAAFNLIYLCIRQFFTHTREPKNTRKLVILYDAKQKTQEQRKVQVQYLLLFPRPIFKTSNNATKGVLGYFHILFYNIILSYWHFNVNHTSTAAIADYPVPWQQDVLSYTVKVNNAP